MSYKTSMACAGAFAAAVTLAGISPTAPAFAHELRLLPLDPAIPGPLKISLLVGHHVEPAFEDSFNAVDVILSTFDGYCPANANIPIGQPIDTGGAPGDTVNLQVDALYLFKSAPPTGPFGSKAPPRIITHLTLTNQFPLEEAFSSPGTYDSYYRPTHPGDGTNGAYGFHVYGTVKAGPKSFTCPGGTPQSLAARTAKINAYYVCGPKGTFTPPDNFGCVTAIQTFPGEAEDGYEPNRPFLPHGD